MFQTMPGRHVVATSLLVLTVLVGTVARAASPAADGALASRPTDGAALYEKYCQLCHGAKMEGYAADNAPSLVSSTFRASASDAFLQSVIERGRAGTAMAGYGRAVGGPLGPAEVDALIVHIRGGTHPTAPAPNPSKGDVAKGATVYTAHCQTCHGTVEQRGNAVHLANAMFLASASDAFLRLAVVEGRPGTPMEAWKGKLSDPEIENVVAYLRSLARAVPAAPAAPAPAASPASPILNPAGKAPDLDLKLGRYASVTAVARAYKDQRRMILIDARPPSDYARMHIPGAISVPYFDMRSLDDVPNDGTWVIAYCVCPHEESGRVLEELRKRGYPNTAILDEGLFIWQQQGYPVTLAEGQLPIPAPPPMR